MIIMQVMKILYLLIWPKISQKINRSIYGL